MAEALNSLLKPECIRNPAMRPTVAGNRWVRRLVNHRRLHGEVGLVPPAEFETNHWAAQATEHYRENPVLTQAGSN